MRRNPDMSPEDCLTAVNRQFQIPEPQAPYVPPQIAALETEVATLEAQLDEAGANEGLMNATIAANLKALSKANAKLEAERTRAELHQDQDNRVRQSNADFEAQRQGVLDRAAATYPQLKDKESALSLVMSKLASDAAKITDQTHPDYIAVRSLNAPTYFAEKAAAKLALKPTGSTPPSIPPPAQPQVRTPAPAPGSKATAPPPPAMSLEQAKAALDKETDDILFGRAGGYNAKQESSMLILR